MSKLDETKIIKIFQGKLGNKKFVSEDVETFKVGKQNIVVKVDTLVQSTDIPPKMKLDDAARKSIVACISDFASKGVKPKFAIISVNLPKSITASKVRDIARGLKKASDEFGLKILGGDTNEGKEIVFHACVFGESAKISPRRGAKLEDIIFATGPFGLTGSGLKVLLENKKGSGSFKKKCTSAVFRPKPRLEFGVKSKRYFTSSMDSSDGLSTTLNEMAKQSNHKFVINNIPTEDKVYDFAKQNKIDPMNLIFHGGEEYEFVFTISKKDKNSIIKIASRLNTPIIEAGYVTKGKGVFVKKDEKLSRLRDLGWHHFKK